ncbi:hypothetical protein HZA57_05975 [Candidatus Poribacteria bacterium]|nr:hypothetical protein [Candidatus Poribacteria bacterium]
MVILVVACLALTIYLLYRAGLRHVQLQRRHDEVQHMASIGTMASGLAHEIRNPLHAMNLHLSAAADELDDPREGSPDHVRRIVGNVQRQIGSLNTILTNFMNYAMPTKLEAEPLRAAALVREVGLLLEPEFERRGVSFACDVPESAWIMADPSGVRQVLLNVLLNAAQALEEAPQREIRVELKNIETGRAHLTIDDTGPGLPPGKEEGIFDVFVSHRKGGTGFGLAIARRIMEELDGSIHGQTRTGGGARFTLTFRAGHEPENYQAISAGGSASPSRRAEQATAGSS